MLRLPDLERSTTRVCILMRTRAELEPEDRTILDDWLSERTPRGAFAIQSWRIAQAIDVSNTAVKDHRAKRCNCWGKS